MISVSKGLLFCLLGITGVVAQEVGSVIITEIMYNPASSESTEETQYIEIANTTSESINLNGWTIDDEDADGPNTLPNVTLPPYGIAVICGSSQADFEGAWGTGFTIIALKDLGQTMFNLANTPSSTNEIIYLRDNNGVLIDSVNYDDASPWPADNNQSSIYLSIPKDQMNATTNNDGANWSLSQNGVDGAYNSTPFGVWDAVDTGSPGNILGDAALPVVLSSFVAVAGDGRVTLKWVTQSEVKNLGFEIWRAESQEEDFHLLSSYVNNPDLQGQFTTNAAHHYRYVDELVVNGRTYWYRLVDVDVNGIRTTHGPIQATPHAMGEELMTTSPEVPRGFQFYPNFPNPFNPTTTLQFDIPASRQSAVNVELVIYNVLGQPVRVLYTGKVAPGRYRIRWQGKDALGRPLPGGVYIAVFRSEYYQKAVKMMLMK